MDALPTIAGDKPSWFTGLRLDEDDDPELWDVALRHILSEFEQPPNTLVEVGRCSHWLRPHQSTWTAAGGFAPPAGYGGGQGGFSVHSPPQFDWSILLEWTGQAWEPVKHRSIRHSLRIAIPSRTRRHNQAAVHTLWHVGREKCVVFYGFRKGKAGWACTASSDIRKR